MKLRFRPIQVRLGRECKQCKGKGMYPDPNSYESYFYCHSCQGTGKVKKVREYKQL